MIPQLTIIDYQKTENTNNISNKDYFINFKGEKIQNLIEGLEAVKQTIYMILHTQKGAYSIYSLDYGTDLNQYIGKDIDFIKSDLPKEVKNSLLKDNRVLDVYDFTFNINKTNEDLSSLYITFKVNTIYGLLDQEVLNINV